jgi:CRP-like cAMP-binding protein
LRRPSIDRESLRSIALFATLDDGRARRVPLTTHEHHAVTGEPIVEQWHVSRELYVVLDGHVQVTADSKVVNQHGPGGFFGEMPRSTGGRLRTDPVGDRDADAAFGEQLERASRERLARL